MIYTDTVTEDCAENFINFRILNGAESVDPGIGELFDVTVTGFNASAGASSLPVIIKGHDTTHRIHAVHITGFVDHGAARTTKATAHVQAAFTDTGTITVGP